MSLKTVPLTRIFDKFSDIIATQWNEKNMKVPQNPPQYFESDKTQALNSNMNSKSTLIFYLSIRFSCTILKSKVQKSKYMDELTLYF